MTVNSINILYLLVQMQHSSAAYFLLNNNLTNCPLVYATLLLHTYRNSNHKCSVCVYMQCDPRAMRKKKKKNQMPWNNK